MIIEGYPQGIYGATSYVIYDDTTKDCAIIDATCCVDEIKNYIEKNGLNLKYILITHGHFDHIYCIDKLKEKFPNVPVMMNNNDTVLLANVVNQCNMAGIEPIDVPTIDLDINEQTTSLMLGEHKIKVIETKGHSKGGNCYLIDDILFSGDTLFKDSIGRCDLFTGDYKEIEQSIVNKLFQLPDNITVLPGHGEKTTIGYEKKNNPYFGNL